MLLRFIVLICLVPAVAVSASDKTVSIALIYGDSALTTSGIPMDLEGTRLAVAELNRKGGLIGRQIELIELDNGGSALGSRLAANKAANSSTIAVIGPGSSSHALLAGKILQNAEIPMISAHATHPDVTLIGDYIFRICFNDRYQGQALADFAFQDLKAKTAVVLTCTGEKYSLGLAEIFMARFKKNGGALLWEGGYLDTATDFRELLEMVKSYRPDIIFLPGYYRTSGFIIRQCRNMQFESTFLGGDAWSNKLYEAGGNAIEGNYYSAHWNIASKDKLSREFVARYENIYRNEEIECFGLYHDALFLLADAAGRANSLDPALIRNALAQTKDFQGVTGTITIDTNGDPLRFIAIRRFESGSSAFVKTILP